MCLCLCLCVCMIHSVARCIKCDNIETCKRLLFFYLYFQVAHRCICCMRKIFLAVWCSCVSFFLCFCGLFFAIDFYFCFVNLVLKLLSLLHRPQKTDPHPFENRSVYNAIMTFSKLNACHCTSNVYS